MSDIFGKTQRSRCMAAIKSRGNKDTELKLIAILRRHSIPGWRRNSALLGHPDFVFQGERVVVFVDGCFWHGCPQHGRRPGSNADYWLPKLARNQQRDHEVTRALKKARWRVVRFWEHELKNSARVAARLVRMLERSPLKRGRDSGEITRR